MKVLVMVACDLFQDSSVDDFDLLYLADYFHDELKIKPISLQLK